MNKKNISQRNFLKITMVEKKSGKIQQIALIAAPLISVLILMFLNLDPENRKVTYAFAIAFLMAAWWITEAVLWLSRHCSLWRFFRFLAWPMEKSFHPCILTTLSFCLLAGL